MMPALHTRPSGTLRVSGLPHGTHAVVKLYELEGYWAVATSCGIAGRGARSTATDWDHPYATAAIAAEAGLEQMREWFEGHQCPEARQAILEIDKQIAWEIQLQEMQRAKHGQ